MQTRRRAGDGEGVSIVTNKPNNPPAFPQVEAVLGGGMMQPAISVSGGMALRDYFAAAALPAFMGWALGEKATEGMNNAKDVAALYAKSVYLIADAMLAEREKRHD
jgi:hypothetical protein